MEYFASFEGKIALVTGASRGIGRAIAMTLGKRGAFVVGSATTEQGAQAISLAFEEMGIKGCGVALDVTQVEAVNVGIEHISKTIGAPLILINNAGVTRDNLLMRMKEAEWNETIATNLTGVFHVTKACQRGMLKARWGRIINISSVVGLTGNPGQSNYAATKAGVIAFSKSLAREIASRGITVNVVAPGFIETDMTEVLPSEQKQHLLQSIPLGCMGAPQDIAHAVAFLASEEARYITGETLHVNGGLNMG